MASHFRLYGRPLMADIVPDVMTITGELEGYTAGEDYESRLQINNSVGRCKVEILESTLPPGSAVRIDNLSKEVVVKWPAYVKVEEELSLVPNGNFESGDDGTWMYGPGGGGQGWSIGSGPDYDTFDGTHSARFANYKGGSDLNLVPIPAKVNDYIRATAQVQQGASSDGKAAGSIHMYYLDANGGRLLHLAGNNVRSGSNGDWHPSNVEGSAPAGTAFVQLSISAYRTKQNHPLWVDAVTWDHKYTLGQESDDIYYLSIKVTDGLNQVAYWDGTIEEYGVFYTSKPYSVVCVDSTKVDGTASIDFREPPQSETTDSSAVSASLAIELRTPLQSINTVDGSTISSSLALVLKDSLVPYLPSPDSTSVSSGITLRLHDEILTSQPAESTTVSATIGVILSG